MLNNAVSQPAEPGRGPAPPGRRSRIMSRACAWLLLAFFAPVPGIAARAAAGKSAEPKPYWIKFPKPRALHITAPLNELPSLAPGRDPGKDSGALGFALESLSGLAAISLQEGTGSDMVWLDMPWNDGYVTWRDDILSATGARRIDAIDGMGLIREFARRGVVKGYIVYKADESSRTLYSADSEKQPAYDASVNVATMMSPILRGVIVEESVEPAFALLGLKRLFDAGGKSEEWFFEHHRDTASRDLVSFIDPKVPHCRDYAVATRSLVVYGINPFTDRVLEWVRPNTPVIGWNCGGEDNVTSQTSRWAKFHTASNWCRNLPVMSTVTAGEDIPWERLSPNSRSAVDPLALDWGRDAHFTAFVPTDGDNLQWYTGGFFSNGNAYWNAARRGEFPVGWTAPSVCMSQVAVPTLAHMAATASACDNAILLGGGYYYASEYGSGYGRHDELLEGHIDQLAWTMDRLKMRLFQLNNFDWKSTSSLESYSMIARKVPNLVAILPIQYSPYNAGLGQILWVENAAGDPIPVISARYALWDTMTDKFHGTPAAVAGFINGAAHEGPANTAEHYDWTTVHVWSFFRDAGETTDTKAEYVDQAKSRDPGVFRGVEPMRWVARRLAPHVKLVTPEELAWRVRLHMKTRETLDALARDMAADPDASALMRGNSAEYRKWLRTAKLDSDPECEKAYNKLKDIRFGRIPTKNPKDMIL
jgi:hypothetical protein